MATMIPPRASTRGFSSASPTPSRRTRVGCTTDPEASRSGATSHPDSPDGCGRWRDTAVADGGIRPVPHRRNLVDGRSWRRGRPRYANSSDSDSPNPLARKQLPDSSTDEEIEAWVADDTRPRRNEFHRNERSNEYKLKFDLPNFNGHMHIEECLDWIKSEESFFEYMDIPEDKHVKLVAYKFKGGAAAWWEQLRTHRVREGKGPVRTWHRMRKLIRERFLPTDYDQVLYHQYQQCQQRGRSVGEYTEEFYRLNARVDLHEPERHQVSRYLSGLKESLRDHLALQSIWRLSEAVNLAYRAEQSQSRHTNRSSVFRRPPGDQHNDKQQLPSSQLHAPTPAGANAAQPNPPGQPTNPRKFGDKPLTQPGKSNPYARPTNLRCYRCNQPGHKSNECPQRRALHLQGEDSGEEQFPDAYEDAADDEVEYVEGDCGDPISCIVENLLLVEPTSPPQRHSIFRTRCTILKRVCNVIIDSGSSENLVSTTLVKALHLPTEPHARPYRIGWIKKGSETHVNKVCRLPFSIGKFYQDEILCDVVDMDACYVLLGQPWQFDTHTIHRGRENSYSFRWHTIRTKHAKSRAHNQRMFFLLWI